MSTHASATAEMCYIEVVVLTDLTSKASQTHSVLNSLLNQNQEFSAPGGDYDMHSQHRVPAGMRVAPPPAHNPPNVGDFTSAGSLYPRYNVPHGE